jgi:hypothetical protein
VSHNKARESGIETYHQSGKTSRHHKCVRLADQCPEGGHGCEQQGPTRRVGVDEVPIRQYAMDQTYRCAEIYAVVIPYAAAEAMDAGQNVRLGEVVGA